jgi:flavin reductase (DIM6/NTAB) family NADH-FMN oxidoreductase RutF
MAYLATHSRCSLIIPIDYAVDLTEMKACVVPRPIGWISTRNNQTGVDNLAPYVSHTEKTVDTATRLISIA